MPTGVALRDPKDQLFAAAERVLLRDGPAGLTSRAITDEAGCAKGVLHRHFEDFDAFLAELVRDRADRVTARSAQLMEVVGLGSPIVHLTGALFDLFDPVAVGIVGLITVRDELRARLRQTWPRGVPILAEGKGMITGYLAAERDRGRIAKSADLDTLTLMLIGSAHLLFAGTDAPPDRTEVRAVVTAVVAGVIETESGEPR
ncbi:TetR/AcrR family transcriptional regulator [Actinospica durhamensis]|uniref:TetR/AcrR family transcriptional regulator n=1 Tax=Actinospica durhamensis TaxID=1508375 RepID=A0A941ERD2_9ACTN|nr:TetR/AcrR family transcriptional regulator [Actinospica durhamensis]MBR7835951.1 TetR/AcrR family transcriptional regulator [Actinospica durhamensis]